MKICKKPPFVLKRNEAYIGVLIDDLITKGTEEPYRMFTSRAEFRMLLRQDNADLRLTEISNNIGLATNDRMSIVLSKKKKTEHMMSFIKNTSIKPDEINKILVQKGSSPISQSMKLFKLFSRPQLAFSDISTISSVSNYITENNVQKEIIEQVEIQVKYSGYIDKESSNAEKLKALENISIPSNFDYSRLKCLSSEAKSKLDKVKPVSLSQASRISGVSPADISAMLVFMGR